MHDRHQIKKLLAHQILPPQPARISSATWLMDLPLFSLDCENFKSFCMNLWIARSNLRVRQCKGNGIQYADPIQRN